MASGSMNRGSTMWESGESPVTAVRVLAHALDQAGDVLDHVHAEELGKPTPCDDWNVGRLTDHVVAAPAHFLSIMRGEDVDWSAEPPHLTTGWGPAFRNDADDLIHAWHQRGDDVGQQPDWQTAEFAVHTWDLATALGRPVDQLDPEVAERGLAFMKANLTPEIREPAFRPEQPAPADAGPYEEIAAFAGRTV